MPYKSEKQRRFMHAKHPEIAKQWDKEEKKAGGKQLYEAAVRRLKKSSQK